MRKMSTIERLEQFKSGTGKYDGASAGKHERVVRDPEARALSDAIRRCHDTRCAAWPNYGARGITVCDEWRTTGGCAAFIEHVGRRPSKRHSLDRIDNDRGYEPGNVRWADRTTQNNNRRPVYTRRPEYWVKIDGRWRRRSHAMKWECLRERIVEP